MYRDINSDLIRGNIDTIILKALSNGEKYGVEIAAIVEASCNHQYIIKQPTLYSCLNRLEKQGLTESYWKNSEFGGRRRYYNLTPSGKKRLDAYKEEWAFSRTVLDHLITSEAFDIDLLEKKKSEIIKDSNNPEATNAIAKIAHDAINESNMPEQNLINQVAPQLEEQLNTAKQVLDTLNQTREQRIIITSNAPTLTGRVSAPSLSGVSFAGAQQQITNIDKNPYLKVYGNFDLAETIANLKNEPETVSNFKNEEIINMPETMEIENPIGEEIELTGDEAINYKNILGDVYKEITEKKQTDFSNVSDEENELSSTLPNVKPEIKDENIYENTVLITERITNPDLVQSAISTDFSQFLKLYNQPITKQQPATATAQPTQPNIQITKAQKLSQATNTRFVQYSKLKFFQSIIVCLFMVIASLTVYYLIGFHYPINDTSKGVYILCVLLAAWFVIFRGIFYFINPYDKREISFNLKSAILVKLLAMILTIAIIFSANVFMGFSTLNDVEFYSSLILPSILTLTYLLSSIVLSLLAKNSRFTA